MLRNDAFWPISRQPKELVDRAEAYCKANFIYKAELMRIAVKEYLDRAEKKQSKKK